jgi:hypothetical protein
VTVRKATSENHLPIGFAGALLTEHRHVCAFFASAQEEYSVTLPFIREGFERREKAFHIVDPALVGDHLDRLREAGIDVEATRAGGQLELRTWEEAYLRGGRFDQHAMLALIEEVLNRGEREGFQLTRLLAHMEWSLQDLPGVDDLVEYETRLNYILPLYNDPVI